jgi:hypothetical protein
MLRVRRSRIGTAILEIAVVTALAACSVADGPRDRSPTASPMATTPVPIATPNATASANELSAAAPPIAALAAEGGDPTDGQLGTYTWGDGGSDAPWLPGARKAVGSGEPLTVSFRPVAPIETWSARAVPSTAGGPAGATTLGQGSAAPRFIAPAAGTWTVEVHVVFGNAAGAASYFWQLAVD